MISGRDEGTVFFRPNKGTLQKGDGEGQEWPITHHGPLESSETAFAVDRNISKLAVETGATI
jgi:hypothetical protein